MLKNLYSFNEYQLLNSMVKSYNELSIKILKVEPSSLNVGFASSNRCNLGNYSLFVLVDATDEQHSCTYNHTWDILCCNSRTWTLENPRSSEKATSENQTT